MQPIFRKASIFRYLVLAVLFLTVMAFDDWLQTVEVRGDGPSREASVRFVPISFEASGFAPLRLAGAWKVEVGDPRFGGISALAVDGEDLLALTDSGTVARLPKPGEGETSFLRDLPAGPGVPQFKANRDSEALARDPAGRGWWVAFEHWHQLWLYEPGFGRPIAKVDLGRDRWRANRGLEAIVATKDGLLLFPEGAGTWFRLSHGRLLSNRLANDVGQFTDAGQLPDGRLLLISRRFGLGGIAKRLVLAEMREGRLRLRAVANLGLGAMDNVEAIGAEPRRQGGVRLWLMTDNDFRPRAPTLLVALDLP